MLKAIHIPCTIKTIKINSDKYHYLVIRLIFSIIIELLSYISLCSRLPLCTTETSESNTNIWAKKNGLHFIQEKTIVSDTLLHH